VDAWPAVHFTGAELANPAQSCDAADLDLDGFATLLEYVFHSDPRRPQTMPLVTASIVIIGRKQLPRSYVPHNRFATDNLFPMNFRGLLYVDSDHSSSVSATVARFEIEQWTLHFSAPASSSSSHFRPD
jgi:hypothetical protein